MKKGLVIKTYGDPEITGALAVALLPKASATSPRESCGFQRGAAADPLRVGGGAYIVAAMVPAERVDVAKELHEYLYGVCGGRTQGYYAACIKSARRMYGDNPETPAPLRAAWIVIGMACLIGAAWARQMQRLNRWVLGV